MIRKIIFCIISIFCLSNSVYIHAESFEKLLMPGDVITDHKKYEDKCSNCHEVLNKERQSSLCRACHENIDKDLKSKKGFHGLNKSVRTKACNSCHLDHIGRNADIINLDKRTFPHNTTDFPLKGAHKNLVCNSCHKPDKKYRQAKSQCHECHTNDPHKGKLGQQCTKCHSQVHWTDMGFNHEKTDFKLIGQHKETECKSCHINNKYKNTPKSCYSCHSVDDVHNSKNGKKCGKCHASTSWKKHRFNHDKETKFKLLGRHKGIVCNACHIKSAYKVKIKSECVSCHLKDDSHLGKYGTKCNQCHGSEKWDKIHFRHNRDTDYSLIGKHKKVACDSCHKNNPKKEKLSKNCNTCHRLDNQHDKDSKMECKQCHTTNNWESDLKFDHDMSSFPLIGLHAITSCEIGRASCRERE